MLKINDIHYFDYAATTFICQPALEAYNYFQNNICVMWGKGNNKLSSLSKKAFDRAMQYIFRHFGVSQTEYGMIFGKNTTEIINVIAYSIEHMVMPSDIVLIGPYEHHSNYLPWKYMARRRNAIFIEMPLDANGNIDIDYLKAISSGVKVVAYSSASNTNGFTLNKQKINSLFKDSTLIFTDESQWIAHAPLELSSKASGYVLSSHKMYGPKNIAGAFIKRSLIDNMCPLILGGGMIETQQYDDNWAGNEFKFYAGTYDVGLVMGWGKACEYIDNISYDAIKKQEEEWYNEILNFLKSYPDVTVHSTEFSVHSLISFTHSRIHPHDIESFLAQNNVIIRSGNMCAQSALKKMERNAINRISFGVGISDEDIKILRSSLKSCFYKLGRN